MQAHRTGSTPPAFRSSHRARPLRRSRLAAPLLLLAGVCAGLASGLAQAAPNDLERVTILGARRGAEKIHTDVRNTCPGVEDALAQSLARTQARHQREGQTLVTFRLAGSAITEIRQRGGPIEYRTDIRRAVRQLACQSDAQDKLYAMQLVFVNEAESDDPALPSRRVALVD